MSSKISPINYKTRYKCKQCGAASYAAVIERAASGVLHTTGQYRCSGCRSIFSTIWSWCAQRGHTDFQVSRNAG